MIEVGDSLPELQKAVSQERIEQYASASGDFNPIHINEEFAATSQFEGRIAHGMLIAAFVSEMLTKAFELAVSAGQEAFISVGHVDEELTVSD